MAVITLWHNPRCSKSRETLALLEQHGATLAIRPYLEDAPDAAEIRAALALLGVKPVEMMRSKDALFKSLGLSSATAEATLIAAMAAHPILIERPIAFTPTAAAIGRPPENVLALL